MPGNERVAGQVLDARYLVAMRSRVEVIVPYQVLPAKRARLVVPLDELVAFLPCIRVVFGQVQIAQIGPVQVEDPVGVRIPHAHAVVHVVELLAVEQQTVANQKLPSVRLLLGFVQALDQYAHEAVETTGFRAVGNCMLQIQRAAAAVDLGDGMHAAGDGKHALPQFRIVRALLQIGEAAAVDMRERAARRAYLFHLFVDTPEQSVAKRLAVHGADPVDRSSQAPGRGSRSARPSPRCRLPSTRRRCA